MVKPAVTYVVSRWGAPTQTFVRREAAELLELGIEVQVLSLKRPVEVDEPVLPVVHLSPLQVVAGLWLCLVRHPAHAARCVGGLVRRADRHNLPALAAAVAVGFAWTGLGRVASAPLHSHFGWVSGAAAWSASRTSGVPLSIVLHAFEIHTRRLLDGFAQLTIQDADRVWCVSRRDAAIIADRWGVEAHVLRMGVPAPQHVRIEPTVRRIVAVGSLVEKKGHADLIHAMVSLPAEWTLDIIGDGPLRTALEAQVDELGIRSRVRLLGALDQKEVQRRLAGAWVAALACVEAEGGDRDGIPVALMEAMALGVPVVSTRVGGIEELVTAGGVLVEPHSPNCLASALATMSDRSVRDLLGAEAQEVIEVGWLADRTARPVADWVRAMAAP